MVGQCSSQGHRGLPVRALHGVEEAWLCHCAVPQTQTDNLCEGTSLSRLGAKTSSSLCCCKKPLSEDIKVRKRQKTFRSPACFKSTQLSARRSHLYFPYTSYHSEEK
ncbi:hypothetical protein NDU88_001168 [Pleurodeles waltl]|uniref:Uncharacterized protein n=1 Tax=Pleurodeles waltl TaxID=8319 RepID=A0AAV7U5L9_PLEWA|nr:hypothetical protein NDU88_001168 [Pleurodeles waltl]